MGREFFMKKFKYCRVSPNPDSNKFQLLHQLPTDVFQFSILPFLSLDDLLTFRSTSQHFLQIIMDHSHALELVITTQEDYIRIKRLVAILPRCRLCLRFISMIAWFETLQHAAKTQSMWQI